MKKFKYAIICCLIIVGLALGLVLSNINNTSSSASNYKVNINCAREISMPNNSSLELDMNAISFNEYSLLDFNVTIIPKLNQNLEGLVYSNGVFSSLIVGSYTVTFSIEYSGNTYRDSIVINVEESSISSDYVLYLDSPQLIDDLLDIDNINQLNLIVDDEYIEIDNNSITGIEEGETYITLVKEYEYYNISKELDVQVVANHLNYQTDYNYTFKYVEGEVYSIIFQLIGDVSLTNQKLEKIEYDTTLLEVLSYNSPIIQIAPKVKCTTTITLYFSALDEPIKINVVFI